jgi:hypothetical protein
MLGAFAAGEAGAQVAGHHHDEARAALAAQIWGEGPGVTLQGPPAGGVRLIYQTRRGQAALAYLPAERSLRAVAPVPEDPAARRKRAKLGYALTDRVELFVDLEKRKPSTVEEALAQDWLPPEARRPRTYAVGVTTRW